MEAVCTTDRVWEDGVGLSEMGSWLLEGAGASRPDCGCIQSADTKWIWINFGH
jgi:hypothetical protein